MTLAVLPILFVLSFLGYFVTNRRSSKLSFESFFDKKIKAIPIFVIPYLLLFPIILFTYVTLQNNQYLDLFLTSVILANISATLFWYMFPNGVKRLFLEDKGIFCTIINYIYRHDGDTNGFPSGHVFLSLICTYYLSLAVHNFVLVWIVLGISISISTIYTKQHYIVDIVGGILFALLAIIGAYILF
jgi:membrane-associated phospholipid phosphatase